MSSTASRGLPRCRNCEKDAAIGLVGGNLPLCVDHYLTFMQANSIADQQIKAALNFLHAQMELMTGLPGVLPRFPEPKQPVYIAGNDHSIHIKDSSVGFINAGQMENIARIEVTVTQMKQGGLKDLGDELARITSAAADERKLSAEARTELLELLAALAESVSSPTDAPKRASLIKLCMRRISELIQVSASLVTLWQPLRLAVEKLIHVL
jgi:hypothetical protein